MATPAGPITRRNAITGTLATSTLATASISKAHAQTPPASLVEAAKKEGTVVWHTSIDLPVAQKMTELFEKTYPGMKVQLERSGAERVLQRVEQEYASNIFVADIIESSDASMFVGWKKKGWLASYVPAEVARAWPAEQKDPSGQFATIRAQLSVIAYNTRQVKPEDAPRSFADLLQPKWRSRMVKAHPGYSGTILTSTYATAKALGWDYFDKLAKQRVMQVQSASEPPKKVAQGERSIQVDGSEYVVLYLKESGNPIDVVYAPEGSPIIEGQVGILAKAPHPNAARLYAEFAFSRECQQLLSDAGGMRSFHPDVKLPPGRKPLSEIKILHTPAEELTEAADDVKKRYTDTFGV